MGVRFPMALCCLGYCWFQRHRGGHEGSWWWAWSAQVYASVQVGGGETRSKAGRARSSRGAGFRRAWQRATPMGTSVCSRFATGLPRSGADEARSAGTRTPPARGHQAQDRAGYSKKPRPASRRGRCDVRVYRYASRELAHGVVMLGARCLAQGILCRADAATKPARDACGMTYWLREKLAACIGSSDSCDNRRFGRGPDGVGCSSRRARRRRAPNRKWVADFTYFWTAEG